MTALGLCILAFGLTYLAGRRSLGRGLVMLLFWGYLYGIFRANVQTTFSHFLFDAALVGLYLTQIPALTKATSTNSVLRYWIFALICWPVFLLLMPFQPLLISLVGLRGCVLFIPIALLGSRLKRDDLTWLCYGLVGLNLMSLGFAVAEYIQGVPRFYPYSGVTQIIYNSNDVSGGYLRIPGTFAHAHQYGGTMAATIPYLMGGWTELTSRKSRLLMVAGLAAAFLGILMSATRLNFILAAALVMVIFFGTKMKTSRRVLFLTVIAGLVLAAFSNARFQRFKSLSDTSSVGDRVSGSVNRAFFEILLQYPMGNGLGGGGTSMPYFLEGQVRNPIGLENEYVRILCEQGIIGLLLWIGFIAWYLSRRKRVFGKSPWANARRLVWSYTVIYLATGLIGLGMLLAIPGAAMLLLGIGWTGVPMPAEAVRPRLVSRVHRMPRQPAGWPAHAS